MIERRNFLKVIGSGYLVEALFLPHLLEQYKEPQYKDKNLFDIIEAFQESKKEFVKNINELRKNSIELKPVYTSLTGIKRKNGSSGIIIDEKFFNEKLKKKKFPKAHYVLTAYHAATYIGYKDFLIKRKTKTNQNEEVFAIINNKGDLEIKLDYVYGNFEYDFAILRMPNDVGLDITPVKAGDSDRVELFDPILMISNIEYTEHIRALDEIRIGHISCQEGMKIKYLEAKNSVNESNYFRTDLITYPSQSGASVFALEKDFSVSVIGILIGDIPISISRAPGLNEPIGFVNNNLKINTIMDILEEEYKND